MRTIACLFALIPSIGLANGFSLSQRWEYSTPNHLPQALVVDHSGSFLFAANKSGGIAVFDVRGPRPKRVATVKKRRLADLDAMNICLQGNRLFVALGDFFNRKNRVGLAVLNVKDPSKPEVVDTWISPDLMHGCADVIVRGDTAYLGAMSHGVMTLDVSAPNSIRQLALLQPDIHFPRKNPNSIQHPNARGLDIQGHLLFVAFDAGGLRVLDVSKPRQPREIGRYINQRMRNKQQAYNNIIVDGSTALLAVDYGGLELVDVSDPTKISQSGWWNPWRADTHRNMWFNSPGHTNQLFLDRRQQIVYMSAGDSELLCVDVRDPKIPKLVGRFGQPRNGQGVWGLTKHNNTVYLAYIKAIVPFRGKWSGLKAISIQHGTRP